MPETRSFHAPTVHIDSLVNALSDWFRSQNFNVQQLDVHGGGVLIQASKGGWRNVVGMASALNVVLRQNGADLTVEIGAGKWMDKVGAGAVSIFVLWPLAVTAAWGAWQQSQLPKQTFEFIQQFVSSGESSIYSSATTTIPVESVTISTPSYRFCANCGNSVAEDARFCSKCGKPVN